MSYLFNQAALEQMNERELQQAFDAVFNELAMKRALIEEYHCILSMIRISLGRKM